MFVYFSLAGFIVITVNRQSAVRVYDPVPLAQLKYFTLPKIGSNDNKYYFGRDCEGTTTTTTALPPPYNYNKNNYYADSAAWAPNLIMMIFALSVPMYFSH